MPWVAEFHFRAWETKTLKANDIELGKWAAYLHSQIIELRRRELSDFKNYWIDMEVGVVTQQNTIIW